MGLTKKEIDEMGIDDYYDYQVMLTDVLKLWHAPYMPHDEDAEETINEPEK